MQNTPTGCGSDLPTTLRTFKSHSKSRSVNIFFKCSDLDPNRRKDGFYQPELRLVHHQNGGSIFGVVIRMSINLYRFY